MSNALRQMDNTLCLKTGTILKLQPGPRTEGGGGICHLGGNGGKLFAASDTFARSSQESWSSSPAVLVVLVLLSVSLSNVRPARDTRLGFC